MENLKVGSIVLFKNINHIEDQLLFIKTYPFTDGDVYVRERQSLIFNINGISINAGICSANKVVMGDVVKRFAFGGAAKTDNTIDYIFCPRDDKTISSVTFRFFDTQTADIILEKVLDVVGKELSIKSFYYSKVVEKILGLEDRKNIEHIFADKEVVPLYKSLWESYTCMKNNPRDFVCSCNQNLFGGHLIPTEINLERLKRIKKYLSKKMMTKEDNIFVYDASLVCFGSDREYVVAYEKNKPLLPVNIMMPIGWLNDSSNICEDL
jgi:hypothetical protein